MRHKHGHSGGVGIDSGIDSTRTGGAMFDEPLTWIRGKV
jgi:hypothetical protein